MDIKLTNYRQMGGVYRFTFEMTEAVWFGTYGRGAGKMPPREPIREWVIKHNIFNLAQEPKQYKIDSAVYGICRKIGLEGTKNRPNKDRVIVYEKTISDSIKDVLGQTIQFNLLRRLKSDAELNNID